MQKSIVCLATVLFLSWPPIEAAAAGREVMETITVTASRTPVPLDESGSSVSIITREDLENANVTQLTELLREIPGFAVSRQGATGSITQLRVRGAEANQVLVMIDGIEANDVAQGSEFNFAHILTDHIERVEIVRGPQSALWGSDALAGVVNIITRPGLEPDDAQLNRASGFLEAGSFDTKKAGVGWHHASARASLKLFVDYLDSGGTNISRQGGEEDGYRNATAGIAGELYPAEDVTLSYTLRTTDTRSEFDDIDTISTGLPADAPFVTDANQRYGGLSINFSLLNGVLDQIVSVSRNESENINRTASPIEDVTRAEKDRFAWQSNWYVKDSRFNQILSLVAEYEDIDYEQRGPVSFFGDPNRDLATDTRSVAFEYRMNTPRLAMSASFRHDDNSEFHNADTWRITGSLDLPNDATNFHVSLGESVKNPSFTERFGFFDTFVGNPGLKPETSFGWETGVDHRLLDDRLAVAVTFFKASLEDEINGFVFDPASNAFTAENRTEESKRKGIEMEINWQPIEPLVLDLAHTWLDATENNAGLEIDEIRRPDNTTSFRANYAWANANIRLSVVHTGRQFDNFFPPYPPFQERVRLDSFTLANLAASYRVNRHTQLTLRFDNILDEDYEEVFGFRSPGFGASAGVRVRW